MESCHSCVKDFHIFLFRRFEPYFCEFLTANFTVTRHHLTENYRQDAVHLIYGFMYPSNTRAHAKSDLILASGDRRTLLRQTSMEYCTRDQFMKASGGLPNALSALTLTFVIVSCCFGFIKQLEIRLQMLYLLSQRGNGEWRLGSKISFPTEIQSTNYPLSSEFLFPPTANKANPFRCIHLDPLPCALGGLCQTERVDKTVQAYLEK